MELLIGERETASELRIRCLHIANVNHLCDHSTRVFWSIEYDTVQQSLRIDLLIYIVSQHSIILCA